MLRQRAPAAVIRRQPQVQATALLTACLLYCAAAVSCTQPEKAPITMLLLLETDNGQTVNTRVGDSVRIRLPENATTGYRWAIERYDENLIKALATEPRYTSPAVGSGGEVDFSFETTTAGSGEIALKQWKSWEGDPSVIARFRIRLKVQP